MIRFVPLSTAFALTLVVATAVPSFAEPMKVTAVLKGASETPPNMASGSGELVGTYDAATKKLTWDVTYSGLTGPATMAHFHAPAPAGKAAGVEIPIAGTVGNPIKGEKTLSDSEASNLVNGLTYFNIHTDKNPKGEIRGQVIVAK